MLVKNDSSAAFSTIANSTLVYQAGDMYDCYRAQGKWVDGSIFPRHARESDAGYKRRRDGFCSPQLYTYLLNTYDILWSSDPVRSKQDVYDSFVWDAGSTRHINDWIRRALIRALVEGVSFLEMSLPSQPETKMQMINDRAFPYLSIIGCSQLQRLVVNEVGKITLFAYKFYDCNDEGRLIEKYREYALVEDHYTQTIIYRDKKNPKNLIRESQPTLDFIPIIPIVPSGDILQTSFVPGSPTLGLYQLQKNIAITMSLIDEGIYSQQFSILTIMSNKTFNDAKMGTSNGLSLAPGDDASFITPSPSPIDMMLKRIECNISVMVKTLANMITNDSTQSGAAKIIDRQTGMLQLGQMARYMERIEYGIYEMFCNITKATVNEKFSIVYQKDFSATDVKARIEAALELAKFNLSPEIKSEINWDVVSSYLKNLDDAKLSELKVGQALFEKKNTEPKLGEEKPTETIPANVETVETKDEGEKNDI